jgi:hypothetical protein
MEWRILKSNNPEAWEEISKICDIQETEGMACALEKIKNQLRRDSDAD